MKLISRITLVIGFLLSSTLVLAGVRLSAGQSQTSHDRRLVFGKSLCLEVAINAVQIAQCVKNLENALKAGENSSFNMALDICAADESVSVENKLKCFDRAMDQFEGVEELATQMDNCSVESDDDTRLDCVRLAFLAERNRNE